MPRTHILLAAALVLTACAGQPKTPTPKHTADGPTKTLKDLIGSRIAMPVGLFLTSMDMDRDARITRKEVRDGVAESFEASDTDGDGHLRPIEFGGWSRTYLGSEYTVPGILHFDHDHDGVVSPGEFDVTFDEIQQRLDRDKDGVLIRAELLIEINGAGIDPEAIRAQIEAEMRKEMENRIREMRQRGGRPR